jgi:hypothetical protein
MSVTCLDRIAFWQCQCSKCIFELNIPPHSSGAYGRIQLCKHKPTNELVVLKTIKISEV